MLLLQELTSVLDRYCVKDVNVLGNPGDSDEPDLVDRFYHLLQQKEITDEKAIAKTLYGSEVSTTSNRFKKLKQRLIRRMSNTLFFIDTKDRSYTDLQRAYYLTHREYALASILSGRTASRAARYFYQRVFKRARRYELTSMLMLSAEALRYFAGVVQRNEKKYRYYSKEYERARQLYAAEASANQFFIETITNYDVSAKGRQATFARTDRYLKQLDAEFPGIEMTYTYAFRYHAMNLFRWASVADLDKVIQGADAAMAAVADKPFTANVARSYFLMYKLMAYIQRREFDRGNEVRQEAAQYVEKGLHNWFKLNELSFMLAMHTGRYTEAWSIYQEVTGHANFSSRSGDSREIWILNRAYLYYLLTIGKVTFPTQEDPLGKFRVMKFLNNVPEFSKEKRGMNIPVLVLQILFAVAQRQYDLSIERIEAIEKYCSRYVRRGDHFRSNCFIKVLLQFPIAAFHKVGVKRKAKRYLTMLSSQPLGLADQSYEIEVIPYDVLWELAFESLERKFHKGSLQRRRMRQAAQM
jgi:hypothetical protein